MTEQKPEIIEQVKEETNQKLEEPPMFRVMIYNDDFTTKAFVVEILVIIFHKGAAEANELMWRVHRQGRGVAGVYPREVAETKIATARGLARENGFPLQLSMEPDS
jgi:ATP-dependent Clp protease adaptor protein ClpS